MFLPYGENSPQDSFQEHAPLDIELMISFALSFPISHLSGSQLMDHRVMPEVLKADKHCPETTCSWHIAAVSF